MKNPIVPIDLGATIVSSITKQVSLELNQHLGIPSEEIRILDHVQQLTYVYDGLMERFGVDFRMVQLPTATITAVDIFEATITSALTAGVRCCTCPRSGVSVLFGWISRSKSRAWMLWILVGGRGRRWTNGLLDSTDLRPDHRSFSHHAHLPAEAGNLISLSVQPIQSAIPQIPH
jgi:hypothetical protein